MNRLSIFLCAATVSVAGLSACGGNNPAADTHGAAKHIEAAGPKPEVSLASEPLTIEAGKPTTLTVAITERGKMVPLDVAHEMKVHLLAVNEELSWFTHLHPEEQANGAYNVKMTFPYSGKYLVYTDYKPTGAESTVDTKTLNLAGNVAAPAANTAEKTVAEVDGYTVRFVNAGDLKTNREQMLQFSIEKGGQKLQEKDMQPYLGATAHIVMIGRESKNFLHIHPSANNAFPIFAGTQIEQAGQYRVWVQFKLAGTVHTADFTVNVAEGDKNTAVDNHAGHSH